MKPRVSVIVNTLNEEHNIRNCLECLKWADEIVVVDMHSDDKTAEIAREYTEKVFPHKRMGFADPARQYALEQTTGDWILMVDADELIPRKLIEHLLDIAESDSHDVVMLSFHYHFFGRPSVGNGWGPFQSWAPRFFKRGFLSYVGEVHNFQRINPDARIHRLKDDSCAVVHLHCVSVDQFIDKINNYTALEARQSFATGRSQPNSKLLFSILKEFAWRFIWKKGYKDGCRGLALLLIITTYRVLAVLKLRVMQEFDTSEPDEAIQRRYDSLANEIAREHAESASDIKKQEDPV